jgi:hypothetical protein
MPFPQQLAALALTPLLKACLSALGIRGGEQAVSAVSGFLAGHLGDQSRRLVTALERANRNAWKAVEVALAGESLGTLLDRIEHREFRAQVRAFLDAVLLPDEGESFRRQCRRELRAARQAGFLEGALDAEALAWSAGSFARFADVEGLLEAEVRDLAAMAEACRSAGYPALARLIDLRAGREGPSLLVIAARYFFRREVESDPELYRSLTWARLETLQQAQDSGFAQLAAALAAHGEIVEQLLGSLQETVTQTRDIALDIQDELLALARRFDLLQRELRPRDSLCIGSETERLLVKEVIARYRALPEEQRRRLPELLGAVGKLEVAAGAFAEARQDFQEAARLVPEGPARAEAHFNAYAAALEQGDWPAALASLGQAAALDPARFAPFPLNKYEPERILGAGGFGVAFLCRNRHSGSRVVLKTLRPDTLERSVADVFREAHLLEELDHPAIIRLRDCDYADGGMARPYLVMDYFEGTTLDEHVRKNGTVPADELPALMVPVAEALQAAHARGILHRDVKPANLLVRPGGETGAWRVKLIDFGLALKQDVLHTAGQKTLMGQSVTGTLEYAAPEQLGRLPGVSVGPATDVYGFGKTCCFALFQTAQPLRRHWRDVPEALADLIEQCLCEQPAERLAGMDAVLERLRALDRRQSESKPEPEPVKEAPGERRPDQWWRDVPGPGGAASRLRGHEGAVHCLALTLHGERLLSGGADGTLRLWDVRSGNELSAIQVQAGPVRVAAFVGHPRCALSAADDQSVRYWDLQDAAQVHVFPGRSNGSLAVSADCRLALSGNTIDGMVRLWEVSTGRELRRFKGHMSWVRGLAFSASGQHALSCSDDGTVRLWEVDTGRELRRLTGHKGPALAVAFTGGGQHALSGGDDGTLRLWDLRAGHEVRCLAQAGEPVRDVAASADRRFALAACGNAVRRWELEWSQRPWKLVSCRELPALRGHADTVLSVAIAPDSKLAASGGADGAILLWAMP